MRPSISGNRISVKGIVRDSNNTLRKDDNMFQCQIKEMSDRFLVTIGYGVHERRILFRYSDEWQGFDINGIQFDAHLLVEKLEDGTDEKSFTIYRVVDGSTDTSEEGQQEAKVAWFMKKKLATTIFDDPRILSFGDNTHDEGRLSTASYVVDWNSVYRQVRDFTTSATVNPVQIDYAELERRIMEETERRRSEEFRRRYDRIRFSGQHQTETNDDANNSEELRRPIRFFGQGVHINPNTEILIDHQTDNAPDEVDNSGEDSEE